MVEYYFDVETTGTDFEKDKIITIQWQRLGFVGEPVGELNILKSWESSEKDVFPKRERNSRRIWFSKRMKRLARLLNNTRFLKIHYHTFRHCKAIREYHRTKDILYIKTVLGHKSLMTTQRYVEIYNQIYGDSTTGQFITKIALTKEQRITLLDDGWAFIKNDDNEWYFRKPK